MPSLRFFLLASVLGLGLPGSAHAQRTVHDQVNAWLSWFGDVGLAEGWAIDWDASWRRHGPVNAPAQVLWRAAIRRNLTPTLRVGIGYAGSETSPYGDVPIAVRTPEHRVFEQVQLLHTTARVQMQHRYRLEQRWTGRSVRAGSGRDVQNWVRTNRMRYFFRTVVPQRGNAVDDDELYLNGTAELFMNFGANIQGNVFDQLRLQATVGRRLDRHLRVETGYLNQLLLKPNGRDLERNHTWLTVLTTSW